MKKVKQIDAKKFYTLGEIVREKLIPGVTNTMIASRLIQTDLKRNKVLNGARVSRGLFGVQYKVQGKNIIKYLVQLDEQKN